MFPPVFRAAIRDLDEGVEPFSMVALWTSDADPTGALGFLECVRPEDRETMALRLRQTADTLDGQPRKPQPPEGMRWLTVEELQARGLNDEATARDICIAIRL